MLVRDRAFNRTGDCERLFGAGFDGGPAYGTETGPDRALGESCGCRVVGNWPKISCCPAGRAWPDFVTRCPE